MSGSASFLPCSECPSAGLLILFGVAINEICPGFIDFFGRALLLILLARTYLSVPISSSSSESSLDLLFPGGCEEPDRISSCSLTYISYITASSVQGV